MKYILMAMIISITSCSGVSQNSLKNVSTDSHIDVMEPIVNKEKSKNQDIVFVNQLARGRYVAVKEDKAGIYYIGPKDCLSKFYVPTKSISYFEGGLWVPHDKSKNIITFVIVGSERAEKIDAQMINNAALAATPNPNSYLGAVGATVGGLVIQAGIDAEKGRYLLWSPFEKGQFDFLFNEIKN